MLKLSTTIYKPIEFEIDGKVHQTKRITNRIFTQSLEISEKMQVPEISMGQLYQHTIDLVVLFTELTREWIMDNLDPQSLKAISDHISSELTKSMGVAAEPPLAGGATGDESPK